MHVGFVSDNALAATSAHTLKFLGQITHVGACDSQDEWMSVPSLPFCVSLPSQPNASFLRGSLTMPGLGGEGFALRKTPLTPATGGHARCLAACLLLCLQLFLLLFSSLAKEDLRPHPSKRVPPVHDACSGAEHRCLPAAHLRAGGSPGTAFHLPSVLDTTRSTS